MQLEIVMAEFIKGLKLCSDFFHEEAEPILKKYYPELQYSAGLIGYGSDVLGYDDPVSRDHMWGPRFYLFLQGNDIAIKSDLFELFAQYLPYSYKGYSVNFTEPDPNDNGVQHPKLIHEGKVNPLIWIQTFDSYLEEQLGLSDLEHIEPMQWLAFSEHRLLSLISGTFFVDNLDLQSKLRLIRYYPKEVKLYLIASNWDIIASEQAFVRRCGDCGDDIGSRIICSRIAERLMRLCFLYKDTYAPYSKWFGTAFDRLKIDSGIKSLICKAVSANDLLEREENIVLAQKAVADFHNGCGLIDHVEISVEKYFGRDIQVIFADKISEAVSEKLQGTVFENVPLIGTMSQIGGLSEFSDNLANRQIIQNLYRS